jgi:hypothetical protein
LQDSVKQQHQRREEVDWTVLRWKKGEDSMDAEVVALHFGWAF